MSALHCEAICCIASVWGQMGRAWTTGERTSRNAEAITVTEFVAFFHQYFGFANNPVPAPFAHERCRCRRYFMGGDGVWTISCCNLH